MDVEYLARATFKLGQIIAKSKSDDFSFADDFLFSKESDDFDELFDEEGVGLVYRIDSDGQTFCIRGVISANLKKTISTLSENRNEEVKKRLKIYEDTIDDVHYFKTKNLEHAKIIYKKLINRRFPIFEEILCNLSDPGFSWWMDEGEKSITIYFKSHGINRAEELIKLGPIGDNLVARKMFNGAYEMFTLLFPVAEFSCSNKSFSIVTSDKNSEAFKIFKSLLLEGKNYFNLEYPFEGHIGLNIYNYFDELAVLRRFWMDAERVLESVSETDLIQ